MATPRLGAPRSLSQKLSELRALVRHLAEQAPVLSAEERAALDALSDPDLALIRAALTRGSPVCFEPEVGLAAAPSAPTSTPADAAPADLYQSSLVGERGVGISVHALIASLAQADEDLAVRVRAALARRGIF